MKEFIFCETCRTVYPISEPEQKSSVVDLIEEFVEFSLGSDDQRQFCRAQHQTELLMVVCNLTIKRRKGEIYDPIVYIAINAEGIAAVIIKRRTSFSENPIYKIYRDYQPLKIPGRLIDLVV